MRKNQHQIDSVSSVSDDDENDSTNKCETPGDGKSFFVKRVVSSDPEYELVSELPAIGCHESVDKTCQKCHKPLPAEVNGQHDQQRRPSNTDSNESESKKEHQLELIRQMLEQQKLETLPRVASKNVDENHAIPAKNQTMERKKKIDSTIPKQEYCNKKKDIMVTDKQIVPVTNVGLQKDSNKNLEDKLCQSFKLRSFQCVENGTRRLLWQLSDHVTKAPLLMLLVPLVVCSLSTIGLILRRQNLHFMTPFRSYQSSTSALSTDTSQPTVFNDSNLRYDALQRMSGSDFAVLFKVRDGGNVLQEDIVDAYLTLKQAVENIKVIGQGKVYKYSTLCRHSQETCEMDVVQAILNSGRNLKFRFPEMEIPRPGKNGTSASVFLGETFGGVETDEDGSVSRARTLAMYFKLKTTMTSRDLDDSSASIGDLVAEWDRQFQKVVLEREGKVKQASLSWWSYDAFSKAVTETFRCVYTYLAISSGVMTIGCMGACAAVHGLGCKIWSFSGLLGTVVLFATVGSAISADVGVTGYLNPATFPAYFMLAASCIFFIVNALQSWHKYNNIIINPAEKLRFIFSWEMSAVVLICITVIISYAIAAVASGTALIRSVCQLIAFGFVFLLLLLLFFYNSLLYLFGRREATSKHWFQSDEKHTSSFSTPILKRYNLKDMEILHRKFLDTSPSLICRKVGGPLSSIYIRYIDLLIFCVYLIFAAWGCSSAPIDLNERQYVRPSVDTDVDTFLTDYDRFYSRYDNYLELTFGSTVDYYSPKVRAAVNDILNWVEYEQHLADHVISWLRDFAEFEKNSIYLVNRDTFVPVVDLIFLRDERYKKYVTDLALGKYNEQIISSRMYIELNRYGMSRRLEIIKFITSRAKESNLPLVVKTPNVFMLAHDVGVQSEIMQIFSITICVTAIVTLAAFAQPMLTVIVVICLISTAVGTIGFAALWNVPLNVVNEATVLAGLSYTFVLCVTCCHFFNNAQLATAKDRLLYSCQSVFHGSLSSSLLTVVTFMPLLIVDCQLIVHQAKLIFLHFAFTTVTCCLLLPPCLILCGTTMPTFCQAVTEMCRESCCCCENEEDATSIYYLPTGGRSVDPLYVQQFFRLKFREDISATPQPALLPPPRREMITAPPPAAELHPPGGTAGSRRNHNPPADRRSRERSRRDSFDAEDESRHQQHPSKLMLRRFSDEFVAEGQRSSVDSHDGRRRRRRGSLSPPTKRSAAAEFVDKPTSRKATRKRLPRSLSPSVRHDNDEPSDPENTAERRSTSYRRPKSPPGGSTVESVEDIDLHTPFDNDDDVYDEDSNLEEPMDPKAKNKISYAKWTKETPLNPFTTERVIAEKYTIEGDGGRLELPPDWKRFWLKGDLRQGRLPGTVAVDEELIGMVPTNDYHRPLHVREAPPPAGGFAYGQNRYVMTPQEFYGGGRPMAPRVYNPGGQSRGPPPFGHHPGQLPPTVHQFVQRPMQPSKNYRKPAYW